MEEVIEQLREANEPVPVPLELPDEDQLVEIEEQLFINIPFVFKEFLLTVSDVVYGSLEPVTVTDPQSHTYLPDVAANAWDAGVPRDLIPLCQDGDNFYCVEEDGTVVLWDGDEEGLAKTAGNRSGTGHGTSGWKADHSHSRQALSAWRHRYRPFFSHVDGISRREPLSAYFPGCFPASPAGRSASANAHG